MIFAVNRPLWIRLSWFDCCESNGRKCTSVRRRDRRWGVLQWRMAPVRGEERELFSISNSRPRHLAADQQVTTRLNWHFEKWLYPNWRTKLSGLSAIPLEFFEFLSNDWAMRLEMEERHRGNTHFAQRRERERVFASERKSSSPLSGNVKTKMSELSHLAGLRLLKHWLTGLESGSNWFFGTRRTAEDSLRLTQIR